MIDSEDILSFMRKFYIKLQKQDVDLLIKEFDADNDGVLSFDEFKSFCLPATSPFLKRLSEMRKNSMYYNKDECLTEKVQELLAKHIEGDIKYV
jgi:hypothetical protein